MVWETCIMVHKRFYEKGIETEHLQNTSGMPNTKSIGGISIQCWHTATSHVDTCHCIYSTVAKRYTSEAGPKGYNDSFKGLERWKCNLHPSIANIEVVTRERAITGQVRIRGFGDSRGKKSASQAAPGRIMLCSLNSLFRYIPDCSYSP